MPSRPSATLTVSGPAELVDSVPYLLGFHPQDSLVLVGLRSGRVRLTTRVDLVDAAGSTVELADRLGGALGRNGVDRLVALVYAEARAWLPGTDAESADGRLLEWVSHAAAVSGAQVGDVLVVAEGRWWSLLCREPSCCAPDGVPLGASSAAAASATLAGLVALPSRGDLEAGLRPEPAAVRARLSGALAARAGAGRGPTTRSDVRALFAAARACDGTGAPDAPLPAVAVGSGAALADPVLVRLGAALSAIPVRDSVWIAVEARRIGGSGLWLQLGRRLPEPWAAPPWFLYGWSCWRAGDGARAGCAAEYALCADPDYSAAQLLLSAVTNGLDPHRTPRLRQRRSA